MIIELQLGDKKVLASFSVAKWDWTCDDASIERILDSLTPIWVSQLGLYKGGPEQFVLDSLKDAGFSFPYKVIQMAKWKPPAKPLPEGVVQ